MSVLCEYLYGPADGLQQEEAASLDVIWLDCPTDADAQKRERYICTERSKVAGVLLAVYEHRPPLRPSDPLAP